MYVRHVLGTFKHFKLYFECVWMHMRELDGLEMRLKNSKFGENRRNRHFADFHQILFFSSAFLVHVTPSYAPIHIRNAIESV